MGEGRRMLKFVVLLLACLLQATTPNQTQSPRWVEVEEGSRPDFNTESRLALVPVAEWRIFGISLGYHWDIFVRSLGYLWDIFGISLGYLWDIVGISLGYLWDIFGISLGYL